MESIKIQDITPDKLIEIENQAEELGIKEMTIASLYELSDLRESALAQYHQIEIQCMMRAIRAKSLGFSNAEIARIFNVTTNTIRKWVS